MDDQAYIESILRVYRQRISNSQFLGQEFLDDFLNFLKQAQLEIKKTVSKE